MKFKTLFMALVISGGLASCTGTTGASDSKKENQMNEPAEVIGKAAPEIQKGVMNPDVLYSFGRVGDVAVSPDRSRILYQVTWDPYNRTSPELFCNSDGPTRNN